MVMNHQSARSSNCVSNVFGKMFEGDPIAQEFSMAKDKASYLIVFGIFPYCLVKLTQTIQSLPYFTIIFDESFNEVLNKSQLDIFVRYFCDVENQVKSRYMTSEFMSGGNAADIDKHLRTGLKEFDLSKLVSVSMDGPNVNLKFLRDFISRRSEELPDAPGILEVGICSH